MAVEVHRSKLSRSKPGKRASRFFGLSLFDKKSDADETPNSTPNVAAEVQMSTQSPTSDASNQDALPHPPRDLPITDSDIELMKKALCHQGNQTLINQGFIHGYAIALWCVRIANRRGLDARIACLTGFFHDVYYFATGILNLRDLNSAEQMRELFQSTGYLSEEQAKIVIEAIKGRNHALTTREPYALMLKDAHILNRYTGQRHSVWDDDLARLKELVPEWKLLEPQRSQVRERKHSNMIGTRSALAEVAQTVASTRISWYAGEKGVDSITHYWPEADTFDRLNHQWSAAFVYHCCLEAGFELPICAAEIENRFSTVKGWLEYACLLSNGFYHQKGEPGFTPGRGDIVVFDRMLEDKQPADHMGIVIMTLPDRITVAEGNMRGSNVSGVIEHSSTHHVRGYIRLPNGLKVEGRR